jgi:hypothetical protein
MGGACSAYGENRSVYKVLMRKPEGKIPLGRLWCGWDGNNKVHLHEVGRRGMDWIELAEDRDRWQAIVNAAMKLRVPKNAGNFLTS